MKIEHAALYVNDLEKARSFFVNYLGAESNDGYHNPRTGFRSYFLSFDGSARLEIMNKPELADSPKEPARTGYAHIAFSTGSREAVDALTARLKADGYEVISGPRITGDGYYESCIASVEGNLIELRSKQKGSFYENTMRVGTQWRRQHPVCCQFCRRVYKREIER